MIDDIQAQRFAAALTDLCKQHGVMIWTATVTSPIMASAVTDDAVFHYVIDRPEIGNAVIIRRVLGDEP
jgi:hypothetical protein